MTVVRSWLPYRCTVVNLFSLGGSLGWGEGAESWGRGPRGGVLRAESWGRGNNSRSSASRRLDLGPASAARTTWGTHYSLQFTVYSLQFTIRGHHLIKLIEAASQGHIHHYYVDTVIDSENVDKQMGLSSQGMSLNNILWR